MIIQKLLHHQKKIATFEIITKKQLRELEHNN
jgi:hypothetical protein